MLVELIDRLKQWLSVVTGVVWQGCVLIWLTMWHLGTAVLETITPDMLRPKRLLSGRIALITGGGGGVGREIALRLGRCGAHVVLWDVDEMGLRAARRLLVDDGISERLIHTYVVDVGDRSAVSKYAELVNSEVGTVHILINNAAVVHGKALLELTDQQIESTYRVNILSHYWTTRCFLPGMLRERWGHVVTVASVAGLLGTHLCTDYSATKFATVGFHESLLTELRTQGNDVVRTTLICPYYIDTGMFAGVRPRLLPMLRPEDVAARIVRALRTDEVFVVMPDALRYLLPLKSWLPVELSWAIMYRVLRGPQTMSTFRGRAVDVTSYIPAA